jgi:hypothetical protein
MSDNCSGVHSSGVCALCQTAYFLPVYIRSCAHICTRRRAQIKHSFKNHKLGVVSVSAAADGLTCVSSSIDGDLHMFDLTNNSLKSTIAAGPVETWQVAVHPKRSQVCRGVSLSMRIVLHCVSRPVSLALYDDSQICATGSHSGHVNIWVC